MLLITDLTAFLGQWGTNSCSTQSPKSLYSVPLEERMLPVLVSVRGTLTLGYVDIQQNSLVDDRAGFLRTHSTRKHLFPFGMVL